MEAPPPDAGAMPPPDAGAMPPPDAGAMPPPDAGAMPPPDAAAAPPPPAGPPTLIADPPACNVPAGGGVSNHTLNNPSGMRLAFKVKSSNNDDYRLKPVFGIVEAGTTAPLEITRTAGPPKADRMVVQFKEAPPGVTDLAALFKESPPIGEVVIPVNAA
ncbi:hypothetical protein AB6A40_000468 [Gnathostoma spinigerum]|uniref:Major sperm protein n=1 Tax=Gnathostoma spinigerum TaxID=75299 RepID=A0ABD6E8S4_9BILA